MSDLVERAKAALEGVSNGPWRADGDVTDGATVLYTPSSMTREYAVLGCPDCGVNGHGYLGDAQFIAAARALVPELVAEVERLAGIVQILQTDLETNHRLMRETGHRHLTELQRLQVKHDHDLARASRR